jgi:CRISPR-associated exonuclease Cas4
MDIRPVDPIPISALEHYSYCPRQCALIHIEQTFDENIYTLRGHMLHERVHEADTGVKDGVRIERSLPIWSEKLGLIGKADVVEYHGAVPYPVEYKLGPRREGNEAAVQLCAQAMCLEEMTGKRVPRGAIYHHGSRRRQEVAFTKILRAQVQIAAREVRDMLVRGEVPPPANDQRCRHCSLRDSCLPRATGEPGRMRELFTSAFAVEDDPVADGDGEKGVG